MKLTIEDCSIYANLAFGPFFRQYQLLAKLAATFSSMLRTYFLVVYANVLISASYYKKKQQDVTAS